MREKSFIFSLDYARRSKEKEFIKNVLNKFDSGKLVGAGLGVNNNPYNLQMLLFLNFKGDTSTFEKWISENYPEKKRRINYFIGDIVEAIFKKGYNIMTFIDEATVDLVITSQTNELFLFPEQDAMDEIWKADVLKDNIKVFMSHSSRDKATVDKIFNELQTFEIRAWYDKYEISPGDSIVDRINEGLENSDVGLICISKNFLNASTGWPKAELNYFIQRRMRSGKNDFICLNFDVPHEELPSLVQEYRYIDMSQKDAVSVLVEALRNKEKAKGYS